MHNRVMARETKKDRNTDREERETISKTKETTKAFSQMQPLTRIELNQQNHFQTKTDIAYDQQDRPAF